jgi:predicted transposase YbfD/YdcC
MDFSKHFSSVTDPRDTRKIDHLLTDILGLAIIGCIFGCDGFEDIEEFGEAKQEWLHHYLSLPNGIPSHDTMERVFRAMNPKEFQQCFVGWVKETFAVTEDKLIHIDGKANRRSHNSIRGTKMLHLVSAFVGEHHLSLAQVKVEDKTNEIKAIPELLTLLDIQDKTITIDAMGCQTNIAGQIIGQGGHYILAVKDNQCELKAEIEKAFVDAKVADTHTQTDKDHGRIEQRVCNTIRDLRFIDSTQRWQQCCRVIRIISHRTISDTTTTETRYYISSQKQDAAFFQKAIRSHWGIENRLHWVLDMLFDEDHCRKRKDNAAENFSVVRKISLNIIRSYKGDKRSLKRRRLKAGWDTDYFDRLFKN